MCVCVASVPETMRAATVQRLRSQVCPEAEILSPTQYQGLLVITPVHPEDPTNTYIWAHTPVSQTQSLLRLST